LPGSSELWNGFDGDAFDGRGEASDMYYEARGMGPCGHHHRSLEEAKKCLETLRKYDHPHGLTVWQISHVKGITEECLLYRDHPQQPAAPKKSVEELFSALPRKQREAAFQQVRARVGPAKVVRLVDLWEAAQEMIA
jgi:hypothetical protein